jgi:hypothetical protein
LSLQAADEDGTGRVPIPPHDNESLRQLLAVRTRLQIPIEL